MRIELVWVALVSAAAVTACRGGSRRAATPVELRAVGPDELRAVADFDVIGDRTARSRALFAEMSRVITHPRCVNCHPAGDSPHQRLAMEPHDPPVVRGPADRGVVGMECAGCHQDRNQPHTRVPGAPAWHLAPLAMAWEGKTVAAICAQLKDPARNGGKSLAQIALHTERDPLVAWGWAPGADREPVPGTQAQFGALTAAWVATGAACPEDVR